MNILNSSAWPIVRLPNEALYRRLHKFDINTEHSFGMKCAYAFISTVDKNPALQLEALRADGYDKLFTVTGMDATTKAPPALMYCLEALQAGDVLTVWKFDSLSSDFREILDISRNLKERGIALRSLTEKIDTSAPGGQLALQYFAAGVEFQRSITLKFRNAALQAARKNGLKTGPARKLTPKQIAHMRELIAHNEPVQDVADLFNISRGTVYNYLKSPVP